MLIVVIDADTGDPATHYRQLMQNAPIQAGIFIFVPKHCIETWLHHLNGNFANEDDKTHKLAYKNKLSETIPSAGARFLDLVRTRTTAGLIPSLSRGVEEATRMPQFHAPQ